MNGEPSFWGFFARGFGLVLVFLASIAVIAILLFAFNVVTAPWKGKGEAFIQKESAQNRIEAQATFQNEYNAIKALDLKIGDIGATIGPPVVPNGTPYDPAYQTYQSSRTALLGTQLQCRNAVASYNADARKYLLQDFRDWDLPEQIGSSDPTTDCQP